MLRNFSLYRIKAACPHMEISAEVAENLGLTDISDLLTEKDHEFRILYGMLTKVPIYGEDIKYRQDIFEDMKENTQLFGRIDKWIDRVAVFEELMNTKERMSDYRYQLKQKIAAIGQFMLCVEDLYDITGYKGFRSVGMHNLHELLKELQLQKNYTSLKNVMKDSGKSLINMAGVTIRIEFDSKLQPEQACFVDFVDEENEAKDMRNPLRKIRNLDSHKVREPIISQDDTAGAFFISNLHPIVTRCMQQLCDAFDRYLSENGGFIRRIAHQLYFYLIAVRMVETFQIMGLKMCRPEIDHGSMHHLEGAYDILTGLQLHKTGNLKDLVVNHIDFNDPKRVFILTGPNRGGKTTFLRTVGITQILFQAGLYVPATAAVMSPVQGIYTHYPKTERKLIGEGRLGEELSEISMILSCITKDSLLLMNESLSSTAAYDSYVMSKNIVKALMKIGTRTVFATHIHELSREASQLNQDSESEYLVVPLSAGVKEIIDDNNEEKSFKRTYVIQEGVSDGNSYAKDIVRSHGMTYDQMKMRFVERSNKKS